MGKRIGRPKGKWLEEAMGDLQKEIQKERTREQGGRVLDRKKTEDCEILFSHASSG